MKQNFIEDNIIILSRQTLEEFLKSDYPSELIALYCFYYYTAKWQKTNQPRATIPYVAKGLKWGTHKTRKIKSILVKLGLVEDIKKNNKKTNKVEGWYIKVNYIWKNDTVKTSIKNHPINLPHGGLSHSVESRPTNALSDSNINALSDSSKMLPSSEGEKLLTNQILSVLKEFRTFNPTLNFGNATQRKAAGDLVQQFGLDTVVQVIRYAASIQGEQYAPVITTPYQLREKYSSLAFYYKKNNKQREVFKV